MSKDIIVLAPNGRRQTIHCTADTSILQILEDVCLKQGFQPSNYNLKHHSHILDLSSTIRYTNLPNKATIEMVEADRKREELNVTVGLVLEDGERRTADFSPHTSLYDLIISLASSELQSLQNPCVSYMRQEVTGLTALRGKTLRMLGLIKGKAILRLINKAEEAKQANVSAVYRIPLSDNPSKVDHISDKTDAETAGPSVKPLDPVSLIRSVKNSSTVTDNAQKEVIQKTIQKIDKTTPVIEPSEQDEKNNMPEPSITEMKLERRLNIEEEVTFLGERKAIAFMQPEDVKEEIDDLPDEFYELTIEEVRKLYHDLQQHRIVLENTPLTIANQKDDLENQTSQQRLSMYKNVVVRIQFPDRIILQGVFLPTNTIQDVIDFVKHHLRRPDKKFNIFTTPVKDPLDPNTTLLEARFVPCVLMHFKWVDEDSEQTYLKEEIYTKITTSDAASILASKYRAPSRRKMDAADISKTRNMPSTSKDSKMPKWFKN